MTIESITRDEYRERLRRVRDAMVPARLDVLVAYANKTHPGHVRYLSGYETRLGIHDSAVCVVTPQRCALLTNASFDRPETQTWLDEVVVTSDYATAISKVVAKEARAIGIAGFPALPAPIYVGLLEHFPGVKLTDHSGLLLALRRIKSPGEIALLRACARITDAGGKAFLESARAGVTEREVLVQVESALKRAGSDEVSFSTQVSSGARTKQVVAFPTDAVLAEGTFVQLDCGATYQGYRGDLSRVAFVGKPAGRLHELTRVAVEIYDRCLELFRPGIACAEIAGLALRIAGKYGLTENLYRSPNHEPGFVAHGIGCSYVEPPEVYPGSKVVLEENMVIVLEPILIDPAVGGVKIEDAVLITSRGPERLSALPVQA
jgi:Xaa-Pro aminopeptidase